MAACYIPAVFEVAISEVTSGELNGQHMRKRHLANVQTSPGYFFLQFIRPPYLNNLSFQA